MGIVKTKDEIKQLRPDLIRTIWPGDNAVDLAASDLNKWAQHGGSEGLVIKDGEEPTWWVLRPLPETHHDHLMSIWGEDYNVIESMAFKLGYLGVEGDTTFTPLHGTRAGCRCMSDDSLNMLGEISMELPTSIMAIQWTDAYNGTDTEITDEMLADVPLKRVSLPSALGSQVLAATFRRRPGAA